MAGFDVLRQRIDHAAEGALDLEDLRRRGALRREPRGGGLHDGAQLDEAHEEGVVRRRGRHPAQHVRVEDVPVFAAAHHGAAARARFDQPFAHQRLEAFAHRRPADAQPAHQLFLGRHAAAGQETAGHHLPPEAVEHPVGLAPPHDASLLSDV